jgi:hypothetical protein
MVKWPSVTSLLKHDTVLVVVSSNTQQRHSSCEYANVAKLLCVLNMSLCQQLYVKWFARSKIIYDLHLLFGMPFGTLLKLAVNRQYKTSVYLKIRVATVQCYEDQTQEQQKEAVNCTVRVLVLHVQLYHSRTPALLLLCLSVWTCLKENVVSWEKCKYT